MMLESLATMTATIPDAVLRRAVAAAATASRRDATTRRIAAIGVAMVVVFGVASDAAMAEPAAAGAVQHQEQALDGSWIVNEDLSDELRPRPAGSDGEDERRRRGGFGGRGGGRGFGERGGRGGFGGRGGGDPQQTARTRADMQEAVRDLMTAPRRMMIVTDRDEIVLRYDDRRVVRLIPDGREHSGLAGTSARVTRRTRWRDATLETEIELQSRIEFRVRQTYEVRISDGNRQLIVTTRTDGGRRGREREFRRVYDVEHR